MKLKKLKEPITSFSIVCAFDEIKTLLSYLPACDTVPVQRNGRTTTWSNHNSGGKSSAAHVWLPPKLLLPSSSSKFSRQLLQASQFFMLDSLKRHCERLAADHLDCENVMDTYSYAKVSITSPASSQEALTLFIPGAVYCKLSPELIDQLQ